MEARTGAVGAPSAAGLSVFDGIRISRRSRVVCDADAGNGIAWWREERQGSLGRARDGDAPAPASNEACLARCHSIQALDQNSILGSHVSLSFTIAVGTRAHLFPSGGQRGEVRFGAKRIGSDKLTRRPHNGASGDSHRWWLQVCRAQPSNGSRSHVPMPKFHFAMLSSMLCACLRRDTTRPDTVSRRRCLLDD